MGGYPFFNSFFKSNFALLTNCEFMDNLLLEQIVQNNVNPPLNHDCFSIQMIYRFFSFYLLVLRKKLFKAKVFFKNIVQEASTLLYYKPYIRFSLI